MDSGHPGGLIFSNGALNVKRVPVAGVGIADHRNTHRVRDVFGVGHHLGHRQQAHIRKALLGGGARAGHVHRVKSHRFGNPGM